ncbi:hypothetical protein H2248_006776 [Termitomyces sp. 'cryptogamus']|nr:hypothetical protein H2248_006776 [Termitomyces sp. 'cryptogamus']
MSSQYPVIEQDENAPNGQDGLPTYNDLAAQHGPNSRFGRWKSWIEKRAAERYSDVSPEERARRRARGWGNEEMASRCGSSSQTNVVPTVVIADAASPSIQASTLQIQTENLHITPPHAGCAEPSPPLPILPFPSKGLPPTHLRVNQFGSRFLPHTTSPIRCLLPLEPDKFLLIGHDEGLSVLDMFPEEWAEDGSLSMKGPDEAQARLIWRGESVIEMSLLEVENTGEGTQQGVVLALVSPEPDAKEADAMRTLRMYNLASIINLAKWSVSQKGTRPLDLHRPTNWQVQQSPIKRIRPQSSFTRGLKSLIDPVASQSYEAPGSSTSDSTLSPVSSHQISPRNGRNSPSRLSPNRRDTDESNWDVIEDLPLRWATDFVPFATSSSRLLNLSVISYALWKDETRKDRGGRLLAIATKNTILLYETPKGERAFRFVKEFYIPSQPRSLTFFKQSVQDVNRSVSDVTPSRFFTSHRRTESTNTVRGHDSFRPNTPSTVDYGTHLSLFVIFDKRASWIRIADSAVGELELYDVGGQHRASETPSSNFRKSRMSFDIAHSLPKWIPPIQCTLPFPHRPGLTREVILITRGATTHIAPSPLPIGPSSYRPLFIIVWRSPPTSISARISMENDSSLPFLQLIGLGGENGIEVQELSLSFLGNGKENVMCVELPRKAEEDLGGDSGFLCTGGHWDQSHHLFHRQLLSRSITVMSALSANSFASMESQDILEKMNKEQGVYAWCRKGLEDWRVLWIGGPLTGDVEDDGGDPDG